MAKRSRDETEEERAQRKRAKKDAKKFKKENHDDDDRPSTTDLIITPVVKKISSCQRKTIRMLFSLYPSDLEDIVAEIKRSLKQNLLKYVSGIEGVLLAFDNVRVVPNSGRRTAGVILNEQPQIHYHADLDTLVFAPAKDMRLRGTVTECFESHVGLLVHNFFNASITSDQLVTAGFSFDDQGEWVHEDGSTTIAAEEMVNFTIEKVHECAGTISMEGMDPTVHYGL
jgi:DNA-directed RNA polymerase subunit E'/Rpb7